MTIELPGWETKRDASTDSAPTTDGDFGDDDDEDEEDQLAGSTPAPVPIRSPVKRKAQAGSTSVANKRFKGGPSGLPQRSVSNAHEGPSTATRRSSFPASEPMSKLVKSLSKRQDLPKSKPTNAEAGPSKPTNVPAGPSWLTSIISASQPPKPKKKLVLKKDALAQLSTSTNPVKRTRDERQRQRDFDSPSPPPPSPPRAKKKKGQPIPASAYLHKRPPLSGDKGKGKEKASELSEDDTDPLGHAPLIGKGKEKEKAQDLSGHSDQNDLDETNLVRNGPVRGKDHKNNTGLFIPGSDDELGQGSASATHKASTSKDAAPVPSRMTGLFLPSNSGNESDQPAAVPRRPSSSAATTKGKGKAPVVYTIDSDSDEPIIEAPPPVSVKPNGKGKSKAATRVRSQSLEATDIVKPESRKLFLKSRKQQRSSLRSDDDVIEISSDEGKELQSKVVKPKPKPRPKQPSPEIIDLLSSDEDVAPPPTSPLPRHSLSRNPSPSIERRPRSLSPPSPPKPVDPQDPLEDDLQREAPLSSTARRPRSPSLVPSSPAASAGETGVTIDMDVEMGSLNGADSDVNMSVRGSPPPSIAGARTPSPFPSHSPGSSPANSPGPSPAPTPNPGSTHSPSPGPGPARLQSPVPPRVSSPSISRAPSPATAQIPSAPVVRTPSPLLGSAPSSPVTEAPPISTPQPALSDPTLDLVEDGPMDMAKHSVSVPVASSGGTSHPNVNLASSSSVPDVPATPTATTIPPKERTPTARDLVDLQSVLQSKGKPRSWLGFSSTSRPQSASKPAANTNLSISAVASSSRGPGTIEGARNSISTSYNSGPPKPRVSDLALDATTSSQKPVSHPLPHRNHVVTKAKNIPPPPPLRPPERPSLSLADALTQTSHANSAANDIVRRTSKGKGKEKAWADQPSHRSVSRKDSGVVNPVRAVQRRLKSLPWYVENRHKYEKMIKEGEVPSKEELLVGNRTITSSFTGEPSTSSRTGKGNGKEVEANGNQNVMTSKWKGKGRAIEELDVPGRLPENDQETRDMLVSDTRGIGDLSLEAGSTRTTPGTAAEEMLTSNTEGLASLTLDTPIDEHAGGDMFEDDPPFGSSASDIAKALFPPDESTDASDDELAIRRRSVRRRSGDQWQADESDYASGSSVPSSTTSSRPGSPELSPEPTLGNPSGIYAGLQVTTWEDIREMKRRTVPDYRKTQDLPHGLHDHINALSDYARAQPQLRMVFEFEMASNVAESEINVPPVIIENTIDDTPCPPWEFYYTNDIWHDADVDPPSRKGLVGCDCVVSCALSPNCACKARQAAVDPDFRDFLYDSNGRFRDTAHGTPIYECNELCRCDDDCCNRVVQRGRKCEVKISKTQDKGWGVFYAGTKKMPQGTFVGIYSGEILTFSSAEARGLVYDKWGRTYLYDLDFHHIKDKLDDLNEDLSESEEELHFTLDAYHVGNFTRFLNHSCDPNCQVEACYINDDNFKKPFLSFFTCKDVQPGEELTFSYTGGEKPELENTDQAVYSKCHCGAENCVGNLF